MKNTDIDNPEILVKDKRILELDEIVAEVKESEEWEGIEMNILEIGIEEGERRGREQGIQQGIQAVVEVCKSLDVGKDETMKKVMEKFSLTEDETKKFVELYW